MSKKHFELVARVIKDAMQAEHARYLKQTEDTLGTAMEHSGALGAIATLANRFASEFADQNPRFDRTRFLKACGLDA